MFPFLQWPAPYPRCSEPISFVGVDHQQDWKGSQSWKTSQGLRVQKVSRTPPNHGFPLSLLWSFQHFKSCMPSYFDSFAAGLVSLCYFRGKKLLSILGNHVLLVYTCSLPDTPLCWYWLSLLSTLRKNTFADTAEALSHSYLLKQVFLFAFHSQNRGRPLNGFVNLTHRKPAQHWASGNYSSSSKPLPWKGLTTLLMLQSLYLHLY